MIPESGFRFPEKIMRQQKIHDPGKWFPLSGKDHAEAGEFASDAISALNPKIAARHCRVTSISAEPGKWPRT